MTRLETHSFWEKLILPLAAASVGVMTLMSLTNDDNRKRTAFANGQFFLIRRSVYEAVGGHAAVRDNITEDVALMRLIKCAATPRGSSTDSTSRRRGCTRHCGRCSTAGRGSIAGCASGAPAPILAAMLFVAPSGLTVYPAADLRGPPPQSR